jgi:probable O-glycosylation ligase (exosortase A-associated)
MFTFLASLSFFTISAGLKALLGGGGYGTILFVSAKNYGMGETSTFSGLVVASVPLLLFLSRNNAIIPCPRLTRCLLLGMIPISVFAVIATAARTGLIASVTLIALYIFRVKHKLLYFVLVTLLVLSIILIAPESWQNRMSTISEYQTEGSALGRTTVWHWTIDFANKHPMGGGFDAYLANRGQLTKYISQNSSSFSLTTSKAFHSIYFEVLGEHGYIGLSLFLAILGFGFTHLFSLIRNLYSRSLTNTWFYDAAWSLLIMLSVFCVTGLFVGVAFGPFLYYFLAMIITLYKLAWKEMKDISK